jgi:hypothetical protein
MIFPKPVAIAAVMGALLALGACKTVTGRIWLPVYANTEDAVGRVTVHFTADCVTIGEDEPLVRLRYLDTVANVSFDAETSAPLCAHYDTFDGIYGEYRGFYFPDDGLAARQRGRTGAFVLEIVDGGDPGYSRDDYLCFNLAGGAFDDYELPARDDIDGDGSRDEGCTYIGGGTVQINLDSTEPLY